MVRISRSSTQPALPLDIFEIIIDILASDKRVPGLISVKNCSLVSQAFLHLCRKHIFARIKIDDDLENWEPEAGAHYTLEEFKGLLKQTRAIGNYIRHLKLTVRDDGLNDFPRLLQRLTRLESLAILQSNQSWKWRSLRRPLRDALLRLLQLPTLTTLHLSSLDDFPLTDLLHGTNLQHLELDNVTVFEDSADASPTAVIFPAKSVQLRELVVRSTSIREIMNARHFIDPTKLTAFSVDCDYCDYSDEVATIFTFLKESEQLIKLDFSISSEFSFAGFGDMVLSHTRALKFATFSILGRDTSDNPLCGIPGELTKIAGRNVLERLSIYICTYGDGPLDEWGILDMVLTSSGWPALKSVSFYAVFLHGRENDHWVETFKQFKQVHFPRLLASKSVDFSFSVVIKDPAEIFSN